MEQVVEVLIEYRQIIWLVGGAVTLFLVARIPTWVRASRGGLWRAERDYATWQLRNALLALLLLIPLLIATMAAPLL